LNNRFEGKVILLTGAAASNPDVQMGFAGETVWRFFREGGSGATLTDISDVTGQNSCESIKASGFRCLYRHLDVTNESHWENVVSETLEEFGRLDFLVNIAGIIDPNSISKIDPDLWQKVIDITLKGVFLGTRTASKAIKDSGGGAIVNISSMGALSGSGTYGSAYSASRSALLNFTKSSALHLAPSKIRVNAILPGWTRTPFTEYLYEDDLQRNYRIQRVPLGRWGEPSEIASGILFMLSDDASYVTGSSLVMDGGVTSGETTRPDNPLKNN
jgi:NAD(P)-dependent dehydrogenase (short-subunit alcohol dehydrogenase family)